MTMPNEKCPCGSGKKYKKCCENEQFRKATPAELEAYEKRRAEQRVKMQKALPSFITLTAASRRTGNAVREVLDPLGFR
jgi:uncharacterized protein YchJ